jgi:hypothetical protein
MLAIAGSACAIWYTRRLALIAEAAHRASRTPQFEAVVTRVDDDETYYHELSLRLLTGPLVSVRVVTEERIVFFPSAQPGADAAVSVFEASGGPLSTGEKVVWRLVFPDPSPSLFWMRVECLGVRKHDRWTTAVEVEVPDSRRSLR